MHKWCQKKMSKGQKHANVAQKGSPGSDSIQMGNRRDGKRPGYGLARNLTKNEAPTAGKENSNPLQLFADSRATLVVAKGLVCVCVCVGSTPVSKGLSEFVNCFVFQF